MLMPRKPVTTREAMIEGAFQLIRDKGYEYLTARNLAAFLGCSTQPVMYQFPNLGQLREEAYRKADAYHSEYIMSGKDLIGIGMRYIRFAEEEPQLFRFLFQSGHYSGFSLEELIRAPEASGILAEVSLEEGMTEEDAAAFFEPLFAVVHGYASLIADNAVRYDPEAIRKALTMIAQGLERGWKENDKTVSEK